MMRFFRTIQKKLIEEDNVRKYLLYAIGEILLVVIGILIALQVNNWNKKTGQTASDSNFSSPDFTPGSNFWKNRLEIGSVIDHNYFNFSVPDSINSKIYF